MFKTKNENFQKVLENVETIEEFREEAVRILRQTRSPLDLLWASKIEVSSAMFGEENINQFYEVLKKLKKHLKKITKFQIIARRKSLISFWRKIQLHLVSKIPLDEIYDELGIRIVVGESDVDSKMLLDLCDLLMNEVLNFLIKEGAVPKDLKQTYKKEFKQSEHPDVFVQEKSCIDITYKNNVKDYIKYPKKNGYQGLHAVVQMKNGLIFEIQVRTMAMDIRAEKAKAEHDGYKKERYKVIEEKGGQIFDLDFSRAKIKGIQNEDGKVMDEVGFMEPIFLSETDE